MRLGTKRQILWQIYDVFNSYYISWWYNYYKINIKDITDIIDIISIIIIYRYLDKYYN